MRPRHSFALVAAGAAVLVAPMAASAASTVLFSQQATGAAVTRVSGAAGTLTLRTGHRPVLVFEERPGRRTGTIGERHFIGLWRGTFRDDAPNALLTGIDAQGRSRRVVVKVTSAVRAPGGVRYGVRALRGSLPTSLRSVGLMVDSVPLSAVSAAMQAYLDGDGNRVQAYEPLINAIRFPTWVQTQAAPDMVISPFAPLTLNNVGAPVSLALYSLTVEAGARVVAPSAGMVSLSFANPGRACDLPAGLSFAVTVTGSDGSVITYPGVSYSATEPQSNGSWVTQSVLLTSNQGSSAVCTLVWNVPPAPQPTTPTVVDRFGPPVPQQPITFTTSTSLTNVSGGPIQLLQVLLQAD